MLKIILQLLLIILIFSCQKQQVPSVVTIKVPEIANDVWMTMSEIVDTAIYIPLETTDECLIDASTSGCWMFPGLLPPGSPCGGRTNRSLRPTRCDLTKKQTCRRFRCCMSAFSMPVSGPFQTLLPVLRSPRGRRPGRA